MFNQNICYLCEYLRIHSRKLHILAPLFKYQNEYVCVAAALNHFKQYIWKICMQMY